MHIFSRLHSAPLCVAQKTNWHYFGLDLEKKSHDWVGFSTFDRALRDVFEIMKRFLRRCPDETLHLNFALILQLQAFNFSTILFILIITEKLLMSFLKPLQFPRSAVVIAVSNSALSSLLNSESGGHKNTRLFFFTCKRWKIGTDIFKTHEKPITRCASGL